MHIFNLIFSSSVLLSAACNKSEADQPRPEPSAQRLAAKDGSIRFLAYPNLGLRKFAAGFKSPIFLTHANDGSGRIYVVEQTGRIQVFSKNQGSAPVVFLDIQKKLMSSSGEMGLLGLAFHPQYKTNGFFYVNYTSVGMKDTVSRFQALADKKHGDPQSEKILLAIPDPARNHNGGMLAFGPDGFLYIGTGDGGGGGDNYKNSRDPSSLLAKMLRLDVDNGSPYAIPNSNPFRDQPSYRAEIWSTGLRNPWRYSFDRKNGDLYIADVGQNQYEEVHFQDRNSAGGEDYGWNVLEGNHCYSPGKNCDRTGKNIPIAEYDHSLGCSVTGGYVYRGKRMPALQGKYFFGDYCSGRIWQLSRQQDDTWDMLEVAKTNLLISSFGEDEDGELYVVDHRGFIYEFGVLR